MRKMISSLRRRRLRIINNADEQSYDLTGSGDGPDTVPSGAVQPVPEIVATELDAINREMFEDCGGIEGTTLRLDRAGAAPIFLTMDRPNLLIGSDSTCDLSLNDVAIRHHHCLLQWLDGHIFCCGLTKRMSQPAVGSRKSAGNWVDHSPITIGPYTLSLVEPDRPSAPDFSPLDRSVRLASEYPRLGFRFPDIGEGKNQWPVVRPITLIGRGSQCRLRLNHKTVHLVHACLVRTETACWLIDLAHDETTRINERAVRVSRIDVGDTVRIGSFQIEVFAMKSATLEQPSEILEVPSLPAESIAEVRSTVIPGNGLPLLPEQPKPATSGQAPVLAAPQLKNAPSIPSVAMIGPDTPSAVKAISIRIQPGAFSSMDCDSMIIQPPLFDSSHVTSVDSGAATESSPKPAARSTEEPRFIEEFAALQRVQLELLEGHLRSLKATYDQVGPSLISNRTREALEKPVKETMACFVTMRELLDRFCSPHPGLL